MLKKPLEEKSYYRWLCFYLEAMDKAEKEATIPLGARGQWAVLIEEEIRALDYFEPVLGQPDTLKAKKLDLVREEIIKNSSMKNQDKLTNLDFDFIAPIKVLQAKEKSSWRLPLSRSDPSQLAPLRAAPRSS